MNQGDYDSDALIVSYTMDMYLLDLHFRFFPNLLVPALINVSRRKYLKLALGGPESKHCKSLKPPLKK